MDVERYEKIFLSMGASLLVLFLACLAYASVGMGIHLPGDHGTHLDPATMRKTAPFDAPGVHQTAPGKYDVVLIGQAWTYDPKEVRIPAGSDVTFLATSADVIHGFMLDGTRLNAMLIPGQVTELHYRFDEPGEHLIICHEYCGLGHHLMSGKVIVE